MPEKTLAQIPRNLRELYEKGNAALQKKNFDYALAIYNQVLLSEPGFYSCREALRACQFAKAGSGGSFLKKMFGTASTSPLLAKAQFQLRGSPLEAIAACEQILNGDPNHSAAHRILAEAARSQEFLKTAVLSLEILFKNNARDLEIGLKLGEALSAAGDIQRAATVYGDLQKAHPTDPTLAQAAKNIAAKRTLRDGGYERLESGEGSYRDILKDEKGAAALEQSQRQVKSEDVAAELIREHEERLAKEPNDRRLLRALGDLHAQQKNFDQALACLEKIEVIDGQSDASIERLIADTRLSKFDHQISQLDSAAEDYPARRQALEREKTEFQLASAKRRVEKYPNDLLLHFELGQLHFQAGRIGEAIQEFQKAQHHPHKKIRSLYYLGQCFAQRNMHDLAVRSLQNAITEKQGFDEEKKEILYALGCVLEKQGKPAEAIEQFKQIYEVDIGFKDVGARVDAFYSNG